MLGTLFGEVRYAVRALSRAPGFVAVAVATLALGVGANTAIFSLIDGIILKPLALHDPERLVAVYHGDLTTGDRRDVITPGNFYDWQAETTQLVALGAWAPDTVSLTGEGSAQRLRGAIAAGAFFEALGVPALYGRTFTAAEDSVGAPPVIVLSFGTWQRVFGGRAEVVGAPVTLGGQPHTVVGVMPPSFRYPTGRTEFWKPAAFDPGLRASRTEYYLSGVGRLAPGATPESAQAELATIAARLRKEYPQPNARVTASVFPLGENYVIDVGTELLVLMAAVGVVLLIACANLANLLLARATVRRREVALRQALGASRARIVRQLLTESVLLGLLGGAAGLVLGGVFLQALVALLADVLPRVEEIAIDRSVLAFTLGVSVLAGLIFGLAPAWQVSEGGSADVLREGARGSGRGGRLRSALVVAEVALAMVLLAASGLLVRSFLALQEVDPGFQTERLTTFRVDLSEQAYTTPPARVAFFETAVERLGVLPGVRGAGIVSALPLDPRGSNAWFNMLDRPVPPGETPPWTYYRVVSPGYLELMGIPLRRGRLLSARDGLDGTPSVVISESLARRFYPDRDPIGREIFMGAPDNKLFPRATIVGIVGDVKMTSLDDAQPSTVYAIHGLMPYWLGFRFVLRLADERAGAGAEARQVIASLDPRLPVVDLSTYDEVRSASMAAPRSSMLLMALFSAIALAMAGVGVFGVLSYSVSQRTRELGIRMALGADAASVRRLVLRDSLIQSGAGVLLGAAAAAVVTRLMASMLFGVSPTDPATFAVTALILLAIALAAAAAPARRATSVDPLEALRCE